MDPLVPGVPGFVKNFDYRTLDSLNEDTLLVDISNSMTKIAVAQRTGIHGKTVVETAFLKAAAVAELADARGCDRAVLASVVPGKSPAVRDVFGDRLLEVDCSAELGVRIDYPEPTTIGADRLANAAAFRASCGGPGVVIDFGTAVTFDIIDAGGAYVGGVIAPGLEAMTDYMFQRTALLPRIELFEPEEVIGKSTRSAMLTGAVVGYRGMVKEILAAIRGDLGVGETPFDTVATGGYAELIARKVPAIGAVRPDFTLEGLRIIASLNPGAIAQRGKSPAGP